MFDEKGELRHHAAVLGRLIFQHAQTRRAVAQTCELALNLCGHALHLNARFVRAQGFNLFSQ